MGISCRLPSHSACPANTSSSLIVPSANSVRMVSRSSSPHETATAIGRQRNNVMRLVECRINPFKNLVSLFGNLTDIKGFVDLRRHILPSLLHKGSAPGEASQDFRHDREGKKGVRKRKIGVRPTLVFLVFPAIFALLKHSGSTPSRCPTASVYGPA